MIHFQAPIRVEMVQEIEGFQTVLPYLYPADIAWYKQQEAISQTYLDSLWIAQSGGMPVGRLAVYINQTLTTQQNTYYIAHYECANDDWVAAYLFKTLLKYIRSKRGNYVMGSLHDTLFANGTYIPKPEYYTHQWQNTGFEEIPSCERYLTTIYPSMPLLPAPYLPTFLGKQL